MADKKPTLKQRYMMHVLLKSMKNMLERNDPYLTAEEMQEEYTNFVKNNLQEFVNNPFFIH